MFKTLPFQMLALLLVHFAAAVIGLQWAMVGGAGSPVWPAAGVALAGLLLGGIRLWPAIFVGRFGAALAVGSTHPVWADLLVAAGNTFSVVVAAWLLLRFSRMRPELLSLRDVLWLAAGAAGAAVIAASIGTSALSATADLEPGMAAMVWSSWVSGNFVGAITIAPAILTWVSRGRPAFSGSEWLHIAAIWLMTALLSYFMFLEETGIRTWVLFPALIWAALAFHMRGGSVALTVASAFAIWGATVHAGIIGGTTESPILVTQQFVAVAALTMLILAATAEERQRNLEWELHNTTRNLDAVLNNTSMAVFMTDEHQRCSYMNPAAETLTGFSFEEIRGQRLHDAVHHSRPDGSPFPIDECPIDRALPENHRVAGEATFVHKDGSFYPVAFTASPIRDYALRTVGTVLEVRNTAEEKAAEAALRNSEERLKRLNAELELRVEQRTRDLQEQIEQRENIQAQLHQSRKMDAIGQLTGGIAHDFNNLLTAVVGGLDMIHRTTEEPRTKRLAGNGLKAAERGVKITAQLLAFSRSQRLEIRPVVAAPIIGGMHDMLAHTLGPSVSLEMELDDSGMHVMADPTQLELAVLNLAINARDAMPDGGRLEVKTLPRHIAADPELTDGEYLEICVSDTGTGMPPEVVARAFDPFFTMKEKGKGTGLGLSMVHGIAKQSGGVARIRSEPGHGTTVSIFLPRTSGTAGEQASDRTGAEKETLERGKGSLLVVDDDPEVSSFAAEVLKDFGYSVRIAENGAEALELFREAAPDLLILDFAMPGMNGAELALAVRQASPDQKILFISGYSESAALDEAAPEATVLRKPFRADDLVRCVRSALDNS